MNATRRAAVVGTCLLALASISPTGSVGAESLRTEVPDPCRRWRVIPTPDPPLDFGHALYGISGTSFRDVWAVGGYGVAPAAPIIGHWDGRGWESFGFQTVQGRYPNGVVAVSPTDVWVVGELLVGSDIRPLLMHWDGVRWKTMASPVRSDYAYLESVTALASNDVWAVGLYDDVDGLHPLTLHWDGTDWRQVPAPDGSQEADVLFDVSAAASDDVWAVGYQQGQGIQFKPLIEHWDGTRWSIVAPEPTFGDDDFLYGVVAISASDAWAVGSTSGTDGLKAMIQHWDGSSWQVVPAAPSLRATVLYDVSAASATDVWAVGRLGNFGERDTLTQHWDGLAWEIVPSPSPGPDYSEFNAVDVISPGNVWAAGQAAGAASELLVEHSRGCQAADRPPA